MYSIRRWVGRLRALFRRDRFDRELRDEIEFHLRRETQQRVAEGMEPDEARRTALRDFGGVQKARQQVHQERWGGGGDALWRDLRYGLRTLVRSPGYAVVAVCTIALAIGADTAVFSVIRGSLLEPLPYPDPGRLVRIVTTWNNQPDGNTSPAEFIDLSARLDTIEAVGAYTFSGLTLQQGDVAERITVAVVTSGVLPALGVEPVLGRGFRPEDGFAQDVRLVITYGFWQQRLGGDPDVVGRTIRVSDQAATILGVLPPSFRMPEELYTSTQVDALSPNEFDPAEITNRGSHYLNAVARIDAGAGLEQARSELAGLVESWNTEYPDYYPNMHLNLAYQPLRERVVGDAQPALLLIGGAVLFILLVACANLAALCLSRYESRHRELALRAALGAARGRLVTQVLIESLLIAGIGGVLGIGLARLGVDALVAASPQDLPRLDTVRLDVPVMLLGLSLSLLAGIGFGLLPAVGAAGHRLQDALRAGERGAIGARGERLRQGLVVLQLALAVALLVGAGLLGHSFLELSVADPGYRTAHVVTARVSLPWASYGEDEERIEFFRTVTAALRDQPGIEGVGAVTNLPLASRLGDMSFRLEGVSYADDEVWPAADWQVVVPGYFEAMGIELLRGRYLDDRDGSRSAGAVVISDTFARTWFPGQDPLGKRFALGGEHTAPGTVTVVGVVADVSHTDLGQSGRSQMYFAHDQFRFWSNGRAISALTVVVQSARPADEVATLVRRTIARLDPSLAVYAVASMDQVRARAVARARFFAILVAVFAGAALLLAAVGVYGVVAYGVAVRRREMGIRMALGARAQTVVRGVVARAVRLTAIGLAIGGVIAVAASRAVSSLLFRTRPLDPATLVAVVTVLGGVALIGSFLPAARATRSAVGLLLREE